MKGTQGKKEQKKRKVKVLYYVTKRIGGKKEKWTLA